LKAKNISYISILPKFRCEENYESPYFELLSGQSTNLEHMLGVMLARSANIQIASKLSAALANVVYGPEEIDVFSAAVILWNKLVELKGKEMRGKVIERISLSRDVRILIILFEDGEEIELEAGFLKDILAGSKRYSEEQKGLYPELGSLARMNGKKVMVDNEEFRLRLEYNENLTEFPYELGIYRVSDDRQIGFAQFGLKDPNTIITGYTRIYENEDV